MQVNQMSLEVNGIEVKLERSGGLLVTVDGWGEEWPKTTKSKELAYIVYCECHDHEPTSGDLNLLITLIKLVRN